MDDDKFEDYSVEVKMSLKKLEKIYKFSKQELDDIRKQFNYHADKNGEINFQRFRKFMGLLGTDEAETVCQRLFLVIVPQGEDKFNLIDFIKYLSSMIFGNTKQKARLSFKFIDKNKRKRIGYQQISSLLCQIAILWNYLTGEKTLPTSNTTELICEKLGILQGQQLSFSQYLQIFQDDIFDWFAFFNDQFNHLKINKQKTGPSLEKIQSLLDVFSTQLYDIILSLKQNSEPMLSFSNQQVDFGEVSPIKGPLHIESRIAPLRGDAEQQSFQPVQFQKILEKLKQRHQSDKSSTFLSKVSDKLKALADLGLNAWQSQQNQKQTQSQKTSNINIEKNRQRKATIMNKGRALKTSKMGTIYLGHQNWNLIVNMMIGIRKSVKKIYMPKEMQCKLTQKHIQEQYDGKQSYQLINKKDEKFEKQYSYTFVDYASKVFYRIRADDGLTNETYLRSIGPQKLIGSLVTGKISTLNQQISQGKTGNFFYYTDDSRFVAKTISQQQCHKIKQNLKKYRQYLLANPNTYIVKIYGLHKLRQTFGSKRYYFVIMENVFRFPIQIDCRYDLKGTPYNRKAKTAQWNKNIALKDQDFIDEKQKIQITTNQKQKIFNQIKKDVHFFTTSNIIEYSLLIGIHRVRGTHQDYEQIENNDQFKGIISKDFKQVYFLGFIDYFTEYEGVKKLNGSINQILSKQSSCIPPQKYQRRIIEFLFQHFFNN